MKPLFAGLDVSTQSCKLVVIDYDAQEVVHVDTVNYEEDLPQYQTRNGVAVGLGEGVSESDPKMWLDAVQMVFRRMAAGGVSVFFEGVLGRKRMPLSAVPASDAYRMPARQSALLHRVLEWSGGELPATLKLGFDQFGELIEMS